MAETTSFLFKIRNLDIKEHEMVQIDNSLERKLFVQNDLQTSVTTNFNSQGDLCPAQRLSWTITGAERGYYLPHKVGRKEKPMDSEANLRLAPAKRFMPSKSHKTKYTKHKMCILYSYSAFHLHKFQGTALMC